MKRMIVLLTALCLILSLAACGKKAEEPAKAEPTPEVSVADMTIAATAVPTPEPTATPDPRNQTERLLDAVLEAEPLTYIGMSYADMAEELGGLSVVDYPPDEDCYFQYTDMPDIWFLYASERYQGWISAAAKSAEAGAISVDKANKEMLAEDAVRGAMFLLSDINMPETLMLPGVDTGITGERKTAEDGDVYYSFQYKGFDVIIYPEDAETLAIDGFTAFCVAKPAA